MTLRRIAPGRYRVVADGETVAMIASRHGGGGLWWTMTTADGYDLIYDPGDRPRGFWPQASFTALRHARAGLRNGIWKFQHKGVTV